MPTSLRDLEAAADQLLAVRKALVAAIDPLCHEIARQRAIADQFEAKTNAVAAETERLRILLSGNYPRDRRAWSAPIPRRRT